MLSAVRTRSAVPSVITISAPVASDGSSRYSIFAARSNFVRSPRRQRIVILHTLGHPSVLALVRDSSGSSEVARRTLVTRITLLAVRILPPYLAPFTPISLGTFNTKRTSLAVLKSIRIVSRRTDARTVSVNSFHASAVATPARLTLV